MKIVSLWVLLIFFPISALGECTDFTPVIVDSSTKKIKKWDTEVEKQIDKMAEMALIELMVCLTNHSYKEKIDRNDTEALEVFSNKIHEKVFKSFKIAPEFKRPDHVPMVTLPPIKYPWDTGTKS